MSYHDAADQALYYMERIAESLEKLVEHAELLTTRQAPDRSSAHGAGRCGCSVRLAGLDADALLPSGPPGPER